MCRCAERREAVTVAVSEALRGNLAEIGSAAAFVVRSTVQDAAMAARRAAHARLRR